MKKTLLTISFLSLIGSINLFGQISHYMSDTLQKTLESRAATLQVKSAAASVVFPDGSIWEGAYGDLDNAKTSPDMLFEMGSNTKTYTAALILRLAANGKLRLDDTLYHFLPVHPKIAHGITVRQLLNHSSGIFSYTNHPNFGLDVNDQWNQIFSMDSILARYVNDMDFAPGTSWSYSNTNYLLLGQIIEQIEGKPYHEALRTLLDSLELKETFLDVFENYSLARTGTWLTKDDYFDLPFTSFMSSAWAAGAIVSTPSDLALWANMLYSGKVLPGNWLDSMKQLINVGGGYHYGLGMFKRTYKTREYIGHGGTTLQHSEMEFGVIKQFSVVTVVNQQDKSSAPKGIQNSIIDVVESLMPGVSTEEISTDNIRFYPNPAKDRIRIEGVEVTAENPLHVSIYSMDGRLMLKRTLEEGHLDMSGAGLSQGVYIIKVSNGGKQVLNEKLIIE